MADVFLPGIGRATGVFERLRAEIAEPYALGVELRRTTSMASRTTFASRLRVLVWSRAPSATCSRHQRPWTLTPRSRG